jgi:hypothetical protein
VVFCIEKLSGFLYKKANKLAKRGKEKDHSGSERDRVLLVNGGKMASDLPEIGWGIAQALLGIVALDYHSPASTQQVYYKYPPIRIELL